MSNEDVLHQVLHVQCRPRHSSRIPLLALVLTIVFIWSLTVARGNNPLSPSPDILFAWGANAASAVQAGEWWRLGAALFLHGSLKHLLLNVIALWWIGRSSLRYLDNQALLVCFFVTGFIGNAFSLHFGSQIHIAVGASGAIMGLAGTQLAILWRAGSTRNEHVSSMTLVAFALCTMSVGLGRAEIDNAAHLAGLCSGLLIGTVLCTLPPRNSWRPLGGIIAAGLMVSCLFAMTAPPAALDIASYFRDIEALRNLQPEVAHTLLELDSDITEIEAQRISQVDMLDRMEHLHYPAMANMAKQLSALNIPTTEFAGQSAAALAGVTTTLANLMEVEIDYSKRPTAEGRIDVINKAYQVKRARESLEGMNKIGKLGSPYHLRTYPPFFSGVSSLFKNSYSR